MSKLKEWENEIVCGDCIELMPQLPDGCVDLVVTDPPYGTNKQTWDKDLYVWPLLKKISQESFRLVEQGFILFFGSMAKLKELLELNPDRLIFQCRNFIRFRPTPIQWSTDPILVWIKSDDLNYSRKDWFFTDTTIPENMSKFHPTPKRLNTMLKLISDYSKKDDLILDPFAGSGTTLVAAKQLNRRFIGFEINQKYVDIANERLRQGVFVL